MKRSIIVILSGCLLAVLLGSMLGCDLAGTGEDRVVIDRVPVFSSPSTIVPSTRSVVPEGMDVGDFFFTILAPPIAGFEETSDSFFVGDSLEVDLFDNSVTLETSLTDDGYIMMSGSILENDENGIEIETGLIEILYDRVNSRFSYYSEILISNPNEVSVPIGPETHVYIVHEIPFAEIESDNSFLANFRMMGYLRGPGYLEIQLVEDGELYSGPGSPDGWNLGFAFVSFNSLRSYSDPPYDFLGEVGIGVDENWILADETGIPVADSNFQARRATIIAARETLFDAEGIRGNPIVGIRTFDDNFTYTTRIYTSSNSTDEIHGVYLAASEDDLLRNENDELVVFTIDETADPSLVEERIEINQANIDLLKSGLPLSDWRTKTNL